MPQITKTGGGLLSKGEIPRIKLEKNTIEVSTNEERLWSQRCNNSSYRTFLRPVRLRVCHGKKR